MSQYDDERMFRRIQHMVRPARTTAPPNEAGVCQRLQVQFNDAELREIPSLQFYGFASSPKPDTDVLVLAVAGDGTNSLVLGSNDQRYRPRNMSVGEVRIYNEAGTYIQIKGGEVNIHAASKVNIVTPETTMSGKLTVEGDITSTSGDVKAGSVSLKQHVHINTQPGSGLSGTPQQ
ncbi:phage baseplate assembly protein [Siccirubricoccus sp. KC 17139]|uniref:Phage baseplate assembly protein n=1 Tax=Siccirubricoccus soli TaxID=2899147 RepID=A0ABT1CYT8_9PROT|nr:phage baseplate assembly protein [Siccirubricoccus soli]MCO6414822.1 phage baseplate assembly protein [Siccirubricoccus soli]MCP2680952.1 phage baseplate assembly protein [Siccirubricoccus soli]